VRTSTYTITRGEGRSENRIVKEIFRSEPRSEERGAAAINLTTPSPFAFAE